jgi:hypothetical protein
MKAFSVLLMTLSPKQWTLNLKYSVLLDLETFFLYRIVTYITVLPHGICSLNEDIVTPQANPSLRTQSDCSTVQYMGRRERGQTRWKVSVQSSRSDIHAPRAIAAGTQDEETAANLLNGVVRNEM